jgi:hypothetical protein
MAVRGIDIRSTRPPSHISRRCCQGWRGGRQPAISGVSPTCERRLVEARRALRRASKSSQLSPPPRRHNFAIEIHSDAAPAGLFLRSRWRWIPSSELIAQGRGGGAGGAARWRVWSGRGRQQQLPTRGIRSAATRAAIRRAGTAVIRGRVRCGDSGMPCAARKSARRQVRSGRIGWSNRCAGTFRIEGTCRRDGGRSRHRKPAT